MKTPEERQCFLMSPCHSGRYSCTEICFNIYLSIINFIWYMAKNTRRRTRVPPSVTRSAKLRGAQRSPELSFRSTNFCVPENLLFPAVCSIKKGVLTNLAKFTEKHLYQSLFFNKVAVLNTSARVSFFINWQALGLQLY